jgi:hypothetical protein
MKTLQKATIFFLLCSFIIGAVLLVVIKEYFCVLVLGVLWATVFLQAKEEFKTEKVFKTFLHPIFNNKQNYKLLSEKIIVWLDLRDSTEYDNCRQENYYFVGQGLHITSITPFHDLNEIKVVTIETSIGQWNPKVLPNLVEALYIIDGLVTRNTEQGVIGYLTVNILFIDYDNKIRVLELAQSLSYYGVDDYRIYKRNLDEIDIIKCQFLYMKYKSNYSQNEYGIVTSIYEWDH